MAVLKVWQRFEIIDVTGAKHVGGSSVTPETKTVDGIVKDETKQIAITSTWDFWKTGAEEPLTDFDLLYIVSDLDGVLVELTTDTGADVGKVVYTIELKKNDPLIINEDGSHANYTADFATGTLDMIDEIRIRNPDGATAANVRAVLVT